MMFYEDEKKRISQYYHKFYLGLFLFCYFITTQSSVTYNKMLLKDGLNTEPITFINNILVFGIITLVIYLNYHLFWVKEQGKRVFIIRKYDIIPLSKKELYRSKFRIIIENISMFIIGAIIIYIVTLLFNAYFEFNIIANIYELFKVIIGITIIMVAVLIVNKLEDYKTKRTMI